MKPFIIYALPRSRTAWLSTFLTYGDRRCGHDIVVEMPDLKKIQAFFSIPNVGTVETGMVSGWKLVKKLVPDIKMVVIRRPILDVKSSLLKFGLESDEELERRDKLLDEIQAQPDVLSISFDELNYPIFCKEIFEHCLELPFDKRWWVSLKDKNIQIDMKKQMEKIQQVRPQIENLKQEVAKMMEAA